MPRRCARRLQLVLWNNKVGSFVSAADLAAASTVACYLIKRAQENRSVDGKTNHAVIPSLKYRCDILTFLIISSSATVYLFKAQRHEPVSILELIIGRK